MKKEKNKYQIPSFLLILCLFSFNSASCQNKGIGYWRGTMEREGSIMDISFEFKNVDNKIAGYFNSASQKASGIPLDSIAEYNDSLSFQLMSEPITYFKCSIQGENISGQIKQAGYSNGRLSLKHSPLPSRSYSVIDTSFASANNTIACRIYLPKAKGEFPAVVFMHGSGSEGLFASQYMAEYFASKGIVTLIQDKEGVGKSTGDWTKASFDDLAYDYLNAVLFLKNFTKVNKMQIGIYGHSQGGTIAPLVATKTKDISFIIAAASIGDTVYKQDLYRVKNNLKSNGFNHDQILEAMAYYNTWLKMARSGQGFEKLDSLNLSAKDKTWFEWVEAPPKEHWIWKYYLKTGNFNSLEYWKSVIVPVLLVYGEKDQIEDINNYLWNIGKTLTNQQGNKDVTQVILPMAQHNLCIFPDKNEKFFWWHISPGYPDLVAGWILYRFKNQ